MILLNPSFSRYHTILQMRKLQLSERKVIFSRSAKLGGLGFYRGMWDAGPGTCGLRTAKRFFP